MRSDNAGGVSDEIFHAMAACNAGVAAPYGDDELSRQVDARLSALFETPVAAFMVPSGTAANALALSAIAGPFDMIVCHQDAHAFGNECGATDAFSGGRVSARCPAPVHVSTWRRRHCWRAWRAGGREKTWRPGALTVTQLTEAGTLYQPQDLSALGALARRHGLRMHMDGARFANALVALAQGFRRRMKRFGRDLSKTRYMAAQLLRYLEDDLWLRNARHANVVARELGDLLARLPGADLLHPVEGNLVFAALPESAVVALAGAGIVPRSKGRLEDGREWFRMVPSFRTDLEKVRAINRPLGT